jgi:hypothetical protein
VVVASVLGALALGLVVFGLIAGTQPPFVLLAIDMLALWIVSTVHHAVGGTPAQRAGTAA